MYGGPLSNGQNIPTLTAENARRPRSLRCHSKNGPITNIRRTVRVGIKKLNTFTTTTTTTTTKTTKTAKK